MGGGILPDEVDLSINDFYGPEGKIHCWHIKQPLRFRPELMPGQELAIRRGLDFY